MNPESVHNHPLSVGDGHFKFKIEEVTKNKINAHTHHKISNIIKNQLSGIDATVQKELRRLKVQSALEHENLAYRNKLMNEISGKISQSVIKKQNEIEKIKGKIETREAYQKTIRDKKLAAEKQFEKHCIKTSLSLKEVQENSAEKRMRQTLDSFRSVRTARPKYQQAIGIKESMYETGLTFANSTRNSVYESMEKHYQNYLKSMEIKLGRTSKLNQNLEENYEKAQNIANNRKASIINSIGRSFARSDYQLKKNNKKEEENNKIRDFEVDAKKKKVTENRKNHRTNELKKIKSCICHQRHKEDEQESSGNQSPEGSGERDINSPSSKGKTRSQWRDSSRTQFGQIVAENKDRINNIKVFNPQKSHIEKQIRVVEMHNEMQRLLQAKQAIAVRANSAKRLALFNVERLVQAKNAGTGRPE